MHSAWTRGRISSLHCQLDTAPWIKLLFFRLLGMLYGEKYISASKAFSKWRQSIKPACKKQSLVMVTFCSLTAFASAVIRGEERGFHVHAGKADTTSTLIVQQKSRGGPSSARRNSCRQTEQLSLSRPCQGEWEQWAPRPTQQNLPSLHPAPLSISPSISHLLFKETTLSSIRSSTCEPHSCYFFIFPQKRADNTITDATEKKYE